MFKGKYYKILFLFLLLITFLFGKFQGGFINWFLFYSVAVLWTYLWLTAKFSLRNIKVSRNLSKNRLTAGDDLEVMVEIFNRFWFPHIYLIVEDDKPVKLKGKIFRTKHLLYPWFRSKTKIDYKITGTLRGVHKWEYIDLMTGDIFGIIQIKKRIPIFSEAVIYPRSYPVLTWKTENKRNIGMIFSQSKLSEETASVIGVREYRKGDRFNRIHWKQSAKVMQLMTKEFERQITNDFLFFLNQESNMYVNNEHFEKAVELTASLFRYAESKRFPAGLVSYGKYQRSVPLARDKEQMLRLFEVLALAEPDSQFSFTDAVFNDLSSIALGTTVVLISTKLDDNLFTLLGQLSFKKFKVEVFIVNYGDTPQYYNDNIFSNDNNISFYLIPVNYIDSSNEKGGITIA